EELHTRHHERAYALFSQMVPRHRAGDRSVAAVSATRDPLPAPGIHRLHTRERSGDLTMTTTVIAPVVLLILVLVVLGAGVWVFLGLVMVGVLSLHFVMDFPLDRVGSIAARIFSTKITSWELAAI